MVNESWIRRCQLPFHIMRKVFINDIDLAGMYSVLLAARYSICDHVQGDSVSNGLAFYKYEIGNASYSESHPPRWNVQYNKEIDWKKRKRERERQSQSAMSSLPRTSSPCWQHRRWLDVMGSNERRWNHRNDDAFEFFFLRRFAWRSVFFSL